MGDSGDFGIVSPLPITEADLLASPELNGIVGFVLPSSKSEWGQILGFLGPMIDLSPLPANLPLFRLPVWGWGI